MTEKRTKKIWNTSRDADEADISTLADIPVGAPITSNPLEALNNDPPAPAGSPSVESSPAIHIEENTLASVTQPVKIT